MGHVCTCPIERLLGGRQPEGGRETRLRVHIYEINSYTSAAEQHGKYTRTSFREGLIHVRPDPAFAGLSTTSLLFGS